jgi:hypothetical protein
MSDCGRQINTSLERIVDAYTECPSGTICVGVSECSIGGGRCVGSCQFGCCCQYPTPTPTPTPTPSLLRRLIEFIRRLLGLGN